MYQTDYLPPLYSLYSFYTTTYNPYVTPIYRFILLAQSYLYRHIFPLIFPLYTLANKALRTLNSDSPDLLALLALGITLYISLRVLDYVRRTIVFWISLVIRLGLYAGVVGLGIYVWQRGLEQSLQDLAWAWGLFEGLSEQGQQVGGKRASSKEREARKVKGARARRTRNEGTGW